MAFVPLLFPDTPSQRVQFILGTEDDDLEHVPHDLFTELDELSFRNGRATEWRETARSVKQQEWDSKMSQNASHSSFLIINGVPIRSLISRVFPTGG